MIAPSLKALILSELGLEEGDVEIDESTTADDVPGWDSLSHARIIAAIEETHGIRFALLEILRVKNVGELQALVDRHRKTDLDPSSGATKL